MSGLNRQARQEDVLNDPKNRLVACYMGTIEHLQPAYLLIEQVCMCHMRAVAGRWATCGGSSTRTRCLQSDPGAVQPPVAHAVAGSPQSRAGVATSQSPGVFGRLPCPALCVPARQVTDIYKKEDAKYARFTLVTMLQHGYQTRAGILTAGNYGAPQVRREGRLWLVRSSLARTEQELFTSVHRRAAAPCCCFPASRKETNVWPQSCLQGLCR